MTTKVNVSDILRLKKGLGAKRQCTTWVICAPYPSYHINACFLYIIFRIDQVLLGI